MKKRVSALVALLLGATFTPVALAHSWDREALVVAAVVEYERPGVYSDIGRQESYLPFDLGSGLRISGAKKGLSGSFQVNLFCCSHHVGSDGRGKLRERNPGLGLDYNFPPVEVLPGHAFITLGNVLNSHGGRARFVGYGWKIPELVALGDTSLGIGLVSMRKLVYGAPDYGISLEGREIRTFFLTLSTGPYSVSAGLAPGDAILVWLSYKFW